MIVPTDINEVKLKLRELGEPIQLFGELVSIVVVLLVVLLVVLIISLKARPPRCMIGVIPYRFLFLNN